MNKIKKILLNIQPEPIILIIYHILFFILIPLSNWYLLMFLPHVILLVFSIVIKNNNNKITTILSTYNHIVFGNKGKGKDLLYQLMIIKRFKKIHQLEPHKINYISNVDYGYGFKELNLKDFELSIKTDNILYVNDYKRLIDNTLKTIKKLDNIEGLDIYISDGGIIMPSTEDVQLNKTYQTFPVHFALSRQLYDQLIGLNTQALNRIWIKLREQQEAYVRCEYTTPLYKSALAKIWSKIPFARKWLFIKVTYYEKYESALQGLLPFSKLNLLGDQTSHLYLNGGSAIKEVYESTNGKIQAYTLGIKIKDIKYDTRIFHKKMFGLTFNEWLEQQYH